MNNFKVKKVTKRSSSRQPTLRSSNFFMTISSNRSIKGLTMEQKRDLIQQFEKTVDIFFNQKLKDFLDLHPSSEETEAFKNIPLEARFVGEQEVDYGCEIGKNKFIPHAHGTLQTKHRALNVKLKFSEIYDWLEEQMGYRIHFDCVVYRNNQMNLEQYISKNSQRF